MPDAIVILFIFSVLASFGLVWFANEIRLRGRARYLEYNFYFILGSVCYGFANWIAPFLVLYLFDHEAYADLTLFVAVFVLLAIPVLMVKIYFLFLLFQELLSRERPAWFNRFSLLLSLAVLLLCTWMAGTYLDEGLGERFRTFLTGLGVSAVLVEILIILRFLVFVRDARCRVIGAWSMPYGLVFLGGFVLYVCVAYSAALTPWDSVAELTPYVYFITLGLPLAVLWLAHRQGAAPVLDTGSPAISRFIDKHALTAREAEILRQILSGASNREIAERNFISPHTVRNHVYNIYKKTGIRNRFQLLAVCQGENQPLVD